MTFGNTERLVFSVILGFAIVFNIMGNSYFEFYPTYLLLGMAYATGITMAVGCTYYMVMEPERLVKKIKVKQTANPLVTKRLTAAPC